MLTEIFVCSLNLDQWTFKSLEDSCPDTEEEMAAQKLPLREV